MRPPPPPPQESRVVYEVITKNTAKPGGQKHLICMPGSEDKNAEEE
jgi:hypothetical protein